MNSKRAYYYIIYKNKNNNIISCDTWSLTLLEEYRLRIFENMISKQIFGLKRVENREWKRLYNAELNDLYHLPNIVMVIKSNRLRWAGHIARM